MHIVPQKPNRDESTAPPNAHEPKLLDRVRLLARTRQLDTRLAEAYVHWVTRFILFHNKRHPSEVGEVGIGPFLKHLATRDHLPAVRQREVNAALRFLFREVLKPTKSEPTPSTRRASSGCRPSYQPPQASPAAAGGSPAQQGQPMLIDRIRNQIRTLHYSRRTEKAYINWTKRFVFFHKVRNPAEMGKACKQGILHHLKTVCSQHETDLNNGLGRAPMPDALARKYPNADREWAWQFVFPASSHYTDTQTGIRHRHHLHESVIQKAMAAAVKRSGLSKPALPTRYDTRSPPLSLTPTTTSARSRNFSATGTCRRR